MEYLFPERRKGGLVGFDPAAKFGWSYAYPGEMQVSGEWHLPSLKIPGEQRSALMSSLVAIYKAYEPSGVFYEAPMLMKAGGMGNLQTSFGNEALIQLWAYDCEIRIDSATPGAIRKAILDDGGIRSAVVKGIVMDWCRARGWHCIAHNAADAALARELGMRRQFGIGAEQNAWDGIRWWRKQQEML